MSLDKNEWVCGKCGFLNAEDGSDLVLCDGPCLGSFHLGCLDSITKKVPYDSWLTDLSSLLIDQFIIFFFQIYSGSADSDWLCRDCTSKKHKCFICKKRGVDQLEVHQCSAPACGKFYHLACLENENLGFPIPKVRAVIIYLSHDIHVEHHTVTFKVLKVKSKINLEHFTYVFTSSETFVSLYSSLFLHCINYFFD